MTKFVNKTKDWLRTGPLHLQQTDLNKLVDNITAAVKSHQSELISGAIQTVRTLAEVAGTALLVILSTFFMLRDGEQIWGWVLASCRGRRTSPSIERPAWAGVRSAATCAARC